MSVIASWRAAVAEVDLGSDVVENKVSRDRSGPRCSRSPSVTAPFCARSDSRVCTPQAGFSETPSYLHVLLSRRSHDFGARTCVLTVSRTSYGEWKRVHRPYD